ncbi:MAG: hypothetical protein J6K16_05130 [Alphaproteobacteria bacterium]|nr:hypothetical protein [Alphaproteobacteria bacterium]
MNKSNNKKVALARLNKMKYYVKRYGIIKAGSKILLPTVASMALNISNVQAQTPSAVQSDYIPTNTELLAHTIMVDQPSSDMLAYERKVVFNINAEVDRRADWFISKFLESAKYHLEALQSCGNKTKYVKENFFDVVSPVRGLPGTTPYCITALNRALMDANAYGGDLKNVLPDPNSAECRYANGCNAFAEYLRQKGFKDCMESGRINYNNLEPGDIILTVRNSNGDRHARQYLGKTNGKHYCLNFNIDGIRELRNSSAIVIHMKKLTKKAIMQNLERENLIDGDWENIDTIVPIDKARKIRDFLSVGMDITDPIQEIKPHEISPMLLAKAEENALKYEENIIGDLTDKTEKNQGGIKQPPMVASLDNRRRTKSRA